MSYILDALRKADAERERDAVPGLHTQPTIGGAAAHGKAASGLPPWVWATLAATALVLLAAALWFAWGGGATREAVTLAPRQVAQAPATAPAPAPPAPATASTAAPTTTPGNVVTAAPSAAPAAAAAASGVGKAPAASAARVESAARTTGAGATAATSAPPGPRTPRPVAARPAPPGTEAASVAKGSPNAEVKPPAPAASAVKVYALHELPAEIRRQLPEVTVGGSMYSPVAADRIVIINGQVLHEGDRIGPELVLQQIKAKSAVFGFKGYRYDMAY